MSRAMVGLGMLTAALVAHPCEAVAQYYRIPPVDRSAFVVAISKPFLGDNYGRLTSMAEGTFTLPLRPGLALTARGGLAYATAGQTSTSTTVPNPSVGLAWRGRGLLPGEITLGVPVGSELGDDDYATDVAVLSDLDRRDRYRTGRWSLSTMVTPQTPVRDGGTMGLRFGGVFLLPHLERGTDVEGQFGFFLKFRAGGRWDFGGEFHGSARLTGVAAGFEDRAQQSLTLFASPSWLPGLPEVLVRLPLDAATRDYVDAVVTLRMTF